MDFDLDAFYRERDNIMNQPDEDLNEYHKRMVTRLKSTEMDISTNLASIPEAEYSTLSLVDDMKSQTNALISFGGPIMPELGSPTVELNATKLSGIASTVPSQSKKAAPPRGSGLPSLRNRTTSRVQENLAGREAIQDSGHLNIDSIRAHTMTTKELDQVSGSPKLFEGENVEKMCQFNHRNKNPGVKRKLSLTELTSPAKRSKGDQDKLVWNDSSIRQTSTPLPAPQVETSNEISDLSQKTGKEDNELSTEILSFASKTEHSLQEQPSPAWSSPISSFSHIRTRSPGSGLRQRQQKARKSSKGLKIPYGHLLNEAILPKDRKEDATMRHSQHDHDDPPTSPIEDLSLQELVPPAAVEKPRKGLIASGSSKLRLEVKERVAKHVAAKQRDKVIRLGFQGVESHSPSGREIFVQEKTPATRAPSASISCVSSRSQASEADRPTKSKVTHRDRTQLGNPKGKNTKKEKQVPVSPAEYAGQLSEKVAVDQKPKKLSTLFLEGKSILYIGGDMKYAGERTRGRMDLIMKYGGRLVPDYDPDLVTHIVTDATRQPTLRALHCKHLSDIPGHIPTVKWSWVKSGINRLPRFNKEDIKARMEEDMWLHAAFSERMELTTDRSRAVIPARSEKSTGTHKLEAQNGASTSTQAQPERLFPRRTSPALTIDKGKGNEKLVSRGEEQNQNSYDPLEEFYAEAREACEQGVSGIDAQPNGADASNGEKWSHFSECGESGSETDSLVGGVSTEIPLRKNRGWTCDNKENRQMPCANQDIIEKLQELQELHKAKPGDEDHWRAFSYNKSIRAIRGYTKRIQSYTEARSIPGVGDKTALKIMEILSTGDLRRIEYERTDDVEVARLYQGIYGVGRSTAYKWYSAGCRTLEDLRNQKGGVRLNPVQLIGLQYYDDINDRMPRTEAKAIFDLIRPIALSIDSRLFVEIMGSYRRGKNDCGDIDILITRPTDDEQTHSGILARLLPILHKEGIITEDLAIPDNFTDLEGVYRGLCRLPQAGSRRRRIDFLTVPWESRGAALLYYTGDDIFNRAMRFKARKMGYSLNQRGLFSGVVRDPKDSKIKHNQGFLVASETEEEIFRILNVPWQEPHERVRG